jgi:hypothetical protein
MERRDFVKLAGMGGASLALASPGKRLLAGNVVAEPAIRINPVPKFELSPWLYMQFMEPLGVTDSSVEAAWNHETDSWRKDVVEVTKELAPGMVRWGGLLCAYYKWKEAVGPRSGRIPMRNLVWGGVETNQVGTAEFVDFCRLPFCLLPLGSAIRRTMASSSRNTSLLVDKYMLNLSHLPLCLSLKCDFNRDLKFVASPT